MIIQNAKTEELDEILSIYDIARQFMHSHGNPTQWPDKSYPGRPTLEKDIQHNRLLTLREDSESPILGVFVLLTGKEPTYAIIENGAWLSGNDYITLHRIASAQIRKGIGDIIFKYAMDYAKDNGLDLRADTHKDNLPMQHVFEKAGLVYCGDVWMMDNTMRKAYQWVNPGK